MRCAGKGFDFLFPFHDQTRSRALYPASGELFARSIGERPGHQITAEAIQHPPPFLGGDQGHIYGTRIGERGAYGRFRDFRIGDALGVFQFQGVLQMPRNSFPLSIGVSSKKDFFRVLHLPGQPGQNILAPVRGNILRFEVGRGHAHFFDGQIAHMADRRGDLPVGAKDFLYLFYFAGGFQN